MKKKKWSGHALKIVCCRFNNLDKAPVDGADFKANFSWAHSERRVRVGRPGMGKLLKYSINWTCSLMVKQVCFSPLRHNLPTLPPRGRFLSGPSWGSTTTTTSSSSSLSLGVLQRVAVASAFCVGDSEDIVPRLVTWSYAAHCSQRASSR